MEYGGYLPIELASKLEYYNLPKEQNLKLNCGRTAILTAVKQSRCNKIYLPYYLCESVKESLELRNIKCDFYNIDERFLPLLDQIEDDAIILWVNYFGIQPESYKRVILEKFENVIFDNTQAFFSKPILDSYNVYSCRKFFGVSDGAYLIHHNLLDENYDRDVSYERALYLLQSIEQGTNVGYKKSLENEQYITESMPLKMSKLTKFILKSIDYNNVIDKRRENFKILMSKLGHLNQLNFTFEEEHVPMVYPFLFKNENLRNFLIESKVYVPQWWKYLLNEENSSEYEKYLVQFLIPLPIDQRYDTQQIEKMADTILHYIESDEKL